MPTLAARIVFTVGAASTGCTPLLIAKYAVPNGNGFKFWLMWCAGLVLVVTGAILMKLSNVYPFINWRAEQIETQKMYGRINRPARNPDDTS